MVVRRLGAKPNAASSLMRSEPERPRHFPDGASRKAEHDGIMGLPQPKAETER